MILIALRPNIRLAVQFDVTMKGTRTFGLFWVNCTSMSHHPSYSIPDPPPHWMHNESSESKSSFILLTGAPGMLLWSHSLLTIDTWALVSNNTSESCPFNVHLTMHFSPTGLVIPGNDIFCWIFFNLCCCSIIIDLHNFACMSHPVSKYILLQKYTLRHTLHVFLCLFAGDASFWQ